MTPKKTYSVAKCDCSRCQACIEMCPELFSWDDINEEVVVNMECADQEAIEQAMAYCPNDCIEMDEEGIICVG